MKINLGKCEYSIWTLYKKINLGECPYVRILGNEDILVVKIPHYEQNNQKAHQDSE